MKYIKKFENVLNFKKYFIAKGINTLFIFEIIGEGKLSKDSLEVKQLFMYNKEKNELQEINDYYNDSYEKSMYLIKDKIIFQSDNLEECKQQIEYIENINKFNL